MLIRTISGAAVGIVTILLLLKGGYLLAAALFILSCIAYRELSVATGVSKDGRVGVLEASGYLGIALYYLQLCLYNGQIFRTQLGIPLYFLIFILQVSLLMLMLVIYVISFPRYKSEQVMAAYFCFLYGPVMLSFIYLTERLRLGGYAVWIIFISSWVCDTSAYFVGRALGRHKMAPVLSPKKTIEGSIGGIAGAALVGVLFSILLGDRVDSRLDARVVFALCAAVGAVISQIGDLAASAIKRDHGIKDYGDLIPGHGGIMDRFDSVIFTAPMIYFLSVLLL